MQSAAHCVLDKTSAKASTTISRPLDNTVPLKFIIAFLCQDAIEPAAKDLEQASTHALASPGLRSSHRADWIFVTVRAPFARSAVNWVRRFPST